MSRLRGALWSPSEMAHGTAKVFLKLTRSGWLSSPQGAANSLRRTLSIIPKLAVVDHLARVRAVCRDTPVSKGYSDGC